MFDDEVEIHHPDGGPVVVIDGGRAGPGAAEFVAACLAARAGCPAARERVMGELPGAGGDAGANGG